MPLEVYDDHRSLSMAVARKVIAQVQQRPDSLLCLAAGDTPRLAYNLLAETAIRDNVDFSRCTFVGLDEWVDIPPENEGSCCFFLQHNLLQPLNIRPEQISLFDALAKDTAAECRRMDAIIKNKGPIDLMLVGVGMNGHVGFNEPGVRANLYAHIIELDETTRSVGQKYFRQATKLGRGITLGMQHFMESRKTIVMASGSRKAEIIRRALEEPISTEVPASMVRKHPNGLTMLDKEASALLTIV